MNTEINSLKTASQTHIAYPYRDDLSMIELLDITLKNKWLIILTTSIISVASIIYAYSVKPTYQVNAYLSLPLIASINEMNKSSLTTANEYSQKSVFDLYISNFQSKKFREDFLREKNIILQFCEGNNIPCIQDTISNFNSNLELNYDDKKKNTAQATLTSSDMNAKETAKTLNSYIYYVNKKTTISISNNMKAKLSSRLKLIADQLEQYFKSQAEDELNKINEAIQIAKNLGYKKPYKQLSLENVKPDSNLHLLGYDYLINKKTALLSRKTHYSQSIKSPELKSIKLDESKLKSINYDTSTFSSVNIDQEAYTPRYPIKPSKRKIAILGFTIGVVLSFFIILIIQVRKNLIAYRLNLDNG